MSAQVIAALRKRADMLEAEGARKAIEHANDPEHQGIPRSPGNLLFLAGEFRKLAAYAEGLDPDGYAKVRDPATEFRALADEAERGS